MQDNMRIETSLTDLVLGQLDRLGPANLQQKHNALTKKSKVKKKYKGISAADRSRRWSRCRSSRLTSNEGQMLGDVSQDAHGPRHVEGTMERAMLHIWNNRVTHFECNAFSSSMSRHAASSYRKY